MDRKPYLFRGNHRRTKPDFVESSEVGVSVRLDSHRDAAAAEGLSQALQQEHSGDNGVAWVVPGNLLWSKCGDGLYPWRGKDQQSVKQKKIASVWNEVFYGWKGLVHLEAIQ